MGLTRLAAGCALIFVCGLFGDYFLTAAAYGFQVEPDYSYGNVFPLYSFTNSIRIGGSQFNVLPPTLPEGHPIEVFAGGNKAGHPVGGVPDTYQPNYDDGYGTGYSDGYSTGLGQGKQRGLSEGTTSGKSDGYNAGWNETYQPAFDRAYANALPFGRQAGWKQGILDGFAEGYDWAAELAASLMLSNNPNHSSWSSAGSLMISSGVSHSIVGNLEWTHTISVPDLSGFYYKLGFDDGNTNGLAAGDTVGYNEAYPAAYAIAYPIGHEHGTTQGRLQGIQDGKETGFSAGWQVGYGPGYDGGFVAGFQYFSTGNLALPNYPKEFGAPLALPTPEPTCFALAATAVAPMLLRRRREL